LISEGGGARGHESPAKKAFNAGSFQKRNVATRGKGVRLLIFLNSKREISE
jgi:hypothetical protein